MSASTTFASALGSAPSKSIVVKTEDGRAQKYLYLPDTMAAWPWPRKINPFYEEVTLESNAWFKSFKPFTPESQYAYDKCDFGRLASLAYPDVSRGTHGFLFFSVVLCLRRTCSTEALRTGIDLMNVFFVVDEYTDVEPAPVVREMIGIVVDALHNPDKPRPEGEIMLGEVTRQ